MKVGNQLLFGVATALCLVAVNGLQTAHAQDGDRARGGVTIGAFVTHRDTETQLNSDSGPGSDIDLEGDLGLTSSTTVGRLGAYFWTKPRQRVDFSMFDLSRTASRRIDKTIEFGDQVFDIDTVVHTKSDLQIIKLDYTFAPLNRERGYLGLTGGLYVAQTTLTLSEATLGAYKSEDLTAPLPVAGVRGEWEITDKITLGGATQWFAIDAGDVSGRFRDFYVGADYRFGRRVGVGLAYNEVSMRIKASERGGYNGRLDWGYDGWLLYVKTSFGL
jgi:hypothetical protein